MGMERQDSNSRTSSPGGSGTPLSRRSSHNDSFHEGSVHSSSSNKNKKADNDDDEDDDDDSSSMEARLL